MSSLRPVQKTACKTSFSVAKQKHTHTCTHSQRCSEMMNAQACLMEKTHTQACTSSFSAILECAGRPVRIHKRTHTHIPANTHMHWACCVMIMRSTTRRHALYMQIHTNVLYHILTHSETEGAWAFHAMHTTQQTRPSFHTNVLYHIKTEGAWAFHAMRTTQQTRPSFPPDAWVHHGALRMAWMLGFMQFLLLTYDTNVLYHRLGLWAPMYRGLGGWEREIHIIIIFFLLKKKKCYIFPTYTYPPPYT